MIYKKYFLLNKEEVNIYLTIHDNIVLQNYIKYIRGIYLSISDLKYLWKIYATFVLLKHFSLCGDHFI